ncbi:MAG: hypothetical protein SNJ49_09510 [Chloracidobacterium sp.]
MELLALIAVMLATLSLIGLAVLYFAILRPLQVKVEEQETKAFQWDRQITELTTHRQADNRRPADQGRVTSEAQLSALQQEVDYLKSQLSVLLTPPETPPQALLALSSAPSAPPTPQTPVPPPHPFENQRVSDIINRYQGRLRRGHIDALTRHFSLNPSGLFLALDERGERLVFPGQEVIYAGDFQQNYSFAYDCDQPGSGYVVVVFPARLDAQGNLLSRGRLRVE